MERIKGEGEKEMNGFRITIPFLGGTKLEVTGKDVFITAIITGIAITLVVLFDHKDVNANEHKVVAEQVKKLSENLEAHTYVLTLSQERREKINLEMPESLRKKVSKLP